MFYSILNVLNEIIPARCNDFNFHESEYEEYLKKKVSSAKQQIRLHEIWWVKIARPDIRLERDFWLLCEFYENTTT